MLGIEVSPTSCGGYLQVQDRKVEKGAVQFRDSVFAIGNERRYCWTAGPCNDLLQFFDEVFIVLNDQNVRRHFRHRAV